MRLHLGAALISFLGFGLCLPAHGQEEIVQQRGKYFTVFAPGSCQRFDQANFDLALNCEFRGANVRFYLKEGLDVNLRAYAFAPNNWQSTIHAAMGRIVNDLGTPEILDRIKIGGSNSGQVGGDRSIITTAGFLYQTVDDAQNNRMNLEKSVQLRLLYVNGLGTAGLAAFSDLVTTGEEKIRGYPKESHTILLSLGPAGERLP
jgi:hypothetical protein